MYLSHTLTHAFVDAERRNPSSGGGGGLSYRARFAIVFAVLFLVWFVARLNGYWVN